MSSETDIANRALTKLGDQRILALTDDTNTGRTMNALFTQVRDAEIQRYRWKFALRRAQISALAEAPAFGYLYQYRLPSNYLALVQVGDIYIRPFCKERAPWSVEGDDGGKLLLTDLVAPLSIRYSARVTNAGLFDPLFVNVLASALALDACETITQSSSKKKDIGDQYMRDLSEAVRCDAIENPPDELPWGTWLESREGASVGLRGSSQFYGASGFTLAR